MEIVEDGCHEKVNLKKNKKNYCIILTEKQPLFL